MNIGIIGYGGFGHFLHRAWDSVPGVLVTAVADPRESDVVGTHFKSYLTADDLLADREIDIVSIATPPSSHAHIACAAMEAGMHVLIEKPMATTLKDADRIIRTRDATGQIATVDYMLRYNPILAAIRDLGRNGEFGSLRRAAIENFAQDEQLPPDHWFWDQAISGGILVEHGTHFLDLTNWLNGSTQASITASAQRRASGQKDRVLAVADYENGLTASYYYDFSRPGLFERTFIDLAYDLANIHLEGWIPLTGTIRTLAIPRQVEKLEVLPGFKVLTDIPLDEVPDDSRPEGWGRSDPPGRSAATSTQVRGIDYKVTRYIEGELSLDRSKAEVYVESIAALQTDMLAAVGDTNHRMGITLEDGMASLEMALRAGIP